MKAIDEELRNQMRILADEFFANNKEADVTKFNLEKLRPAAINYGEYVMPGTGALKRFLQEFPEIFHVYEITLNGGKQWRIKAYSRNNDLDEFGKWLQNIIRETDDGQLLDARLGIMINNNIRMHNILKSYSASNSPGRLTDFLDDLEKSGYIIHDENPKGGGARCSRLPSTPTKIMTAPAKNKVEIDRMHSLAFMGYWSVESKELKKICGDTAVNYTSVVAHNMIASILLNEIKTVDTSQGLRYLF